MTPCGEYRCPNCLKRDLPGIRFGVEVVGLAMRFGMPFPNLTEEDQYIFCLKCLKEGIAGLDKKPGLVAVRDRSGWRFLTMDSV